MQILDAMPLIEQKIKHFSPLGPWPKLVELDVDDPYAFRLFQFAFVLRFLWGSKRARQSSLIDFHDGVAIVSCSSSLPRVFPGHEFIRGSATIAYTILRGSIGISIELLAKR